MADHHEVEELPASMNIAELIPALDGDGWKQGLRNFLHRLLGLYEIHRVFSAASEAENHGTKNLFSNVLDELRMTMDLGDLRQQIPSVGPVVVVANHPYGGCDAVALSGVCMEMRSDTKVLANAMAADLPGADRWLIPLLIMGEEGSTDLNRQAMKETLEHLRSGGLLVVFPAGAVSRWRNDLGRIADPDWSPHIVRLAEKTDAPVLPVRFFGKNPLWFELLGNMHPLLRSAFIIRVFVNMKGKKICFRPGSLIEPGDLRQEMSAEETTKMVRDAVESIDM